MKLKNKNKKQKTAKIFPRRITNVPLAAKTTLVIKKPQNPRKTKNKRKKKYQNKKQPYTQNPKQHLNLYIQPIIDISFLET